MDRTSFNENGEIVCAYCHAPSEYVLRMTLTKIDDVDDKDEIVEQKEADVCLPCGDTLIKNEMKKAIWHDSR